MYLYPLDGYTRAIFHWVGSLLVGLAGAVITAGALWWAKRRRRNAVLAPAITTTLALALFVVGCASSAILPGAPVELKHTSRTECFAGAEPVGGSGRLLPDPGAGTQIEGFGPVTWPDGVTGVGLDNGQVAVMGGDHVIATTGKTYQWNVSPNEYINGGIYIMCGFHELTPQPT